MKKLSKFLLIVISSIFLFSSNVNAQYNPINNASGFSNSTGWDNTRKYATLNRMNLCALCDRNEYRGSSIRNAVEVARLVVTTSSYPLIGDESYGNIPIYVFVLKEDMPARFIQASRSNKGPIWLKKGQKVFFFLDKNDSYQMDMLAKFSNGELVDDYLDLGIPGKSLGLRFYSSHCGNLLMLYNSRGNLNNATSSTATEKKPPSAPVAKITKEPISNPVSEVTPEPVVQANVKYNIVGKKIVETMSGTDFWAAIKKSRFTIVGQYSDIYIVKGSIKDKLQDSVRYNILTSDIIEPISRTDFLTKIKDSVFTIFGHHADIYLVKEPTAEDEAITEPEASTLKKPIVKDVRSNSTAKGSGASGEEIDSLDNSGITKSNTTVEDEVKSEPEAPTLKEPIVKDAQSDSTASKKVDSSVEKPKLSKKELKEKAREDKKREKADRKKRKKK